MAKKEITTYPEATSLQNFNSFGFNSETGAGEKLPGSKIQEAIDDAIEGIGKPLTYKGGATVAQLNAGPSGLDSGWVYTCSDSGTLTSGGVSVEAGDEVAWNGTTWVKIGTSGKPIKVFPVTYIGNNEWQYPDADEIIAAVEGGFLPVLEKVLTAGYPAYYYLTRLGIPGVTRNHLQFVSGLDAIQANKYVLDGEWNWSTFELRPQNVVSPGTIFHPRNEGAYIGGEDTKAWFYGPSGESYTMVGLVADHDITLLPGARLELTLDGSPYINGTLPVYMALAVYDTPDTAVHDYWHYFKVISRPMEARTLYGMRNGLVNQGTPSLNPIVFEVDASHVIKAGMPLFVLFGVRGEDVTSMNAEALFSDTCVGEDCGRYDSACFVSSLYYANAQGTRLITEGIGFAAGLKFGLKVSGSGSGNPKAGYTAISSTYSNFQIVIKKASWLDSDAQETYLTIKPIPQHLKLIARS